MFATRGFDNVRVAEVADQRRRLGEDDLQLLPDQGVAGPRPGRRGDRTGGPCPARAPSQRVADRGSGARAQGGRRALRRAARRARRLVSEVRGDDRLHAGAAGRLARGPRPSGGRGPRRVGRAGRGRSRAIQSRRSPAAPWPGWHRWPTTRAAATSARGCGARRSRTRWAPTLTAPRAYWRPVCGRSTCWLAARAPRTQALEAAKAADEARAQVLKALRQARSAWRDLRRERPGR